MHVYVDHTPSVTLNKLLFSSVKEHAYIVWDICLKQFTNVVRNILNYVSMITKQTQNSLGI
jgi:hypothetical protein